MTFRTEKLIGDLRKLDIEKRLFINNKFQEGILGKKFSKSSPIDDTLIENITLSTKEDVELAVSLAARTYKSRIWVEYPIEQKKQMFLKLANMMEDNKYELALLDTFETGRAFRNYFEDSIPKAIEIVRWFSESIDKLMDESTSANQSNLALVQRVPLGVVGCITPWNDPLVPALWKMIPALLMGNSVIMKPAEQSTFSILKIASFLSELGLPDGVLSVLPGPGEVTGRELALNKGLAGLFFTGSSEIGQKIFEYAGQSNIKKIGLECGGKSAFIVSTNSKQIRKAAKTLAESIFYNQGQICSAPSRAFVHQKHFDEFLTLIKEYAQDFIPKSSWDYAGKVGTLISKHSKERIELLIKQAKKSSQDVVQIGSENEVTNSICPTILINTATDEKVFDSEIFGPVLILNEFEDMNKTVELVNQSQYGLAGSIWTDDLNEAIKVSQSMEAGIIHINSYGEDDMRVPFGGFKQSGIGKEKSLHAFDEYSQLKTTWIGL